MNRNESYREKNRGPAYVPRIVTLSIKMKFRQIIKIYPILKLFKISIKDKLNGSLNLKTIA